MQRPPHAAQLPRLGRLSDRPLVAVRCALVWADGFFFTVAQLTVIDRSLLWEHRNLCRWAPRSLPKLLRSVNWFSRPAAEEVQRVLLSWAPSEGDSQLSNLEVLDARYGSALARHVVIADLQGLDDDDLQVQ